VQNVLIWETGSVTASARQAVQIGGSRTWNGVRATTVRDWNAGSGGI
jgi:hypothetical protein